jgi:uncharacterized protein
MNMSTAAGPHPVILITGASSGIGEATALRFAQKGYRVVLAARRAEHLQRLSEKIIKENGLVLPVKTDITQMDDIHHLMQVVLSTWGQIDILFNNAGFGRLKWLEEQDPVQDIDAQIQVNLWGTIQMSRAVLPQMISQHSGHIINMASIAGLTAMPTYTVYAATKYAIRGFTDALRREASIWGINVSAIYPGAVATEFDLHSGAQRKTGVTTPRRLLLSSEEVAKEVEKVVHRPRRTVIIPRIMIPAVWLTWHFPGIVDWVVQRWFVMPERF